MYGGYFTILGYERHSVFICIYFYVHQFVTLRTLIRTENVNMVNVFFSSHYFSHQRIVFSLSLSLVGCWAQWTTSDNIIVVPLSDMTLCHHSSSQWLVFVSCRRWWWWWCANAHMFMYICTCIVHKCISVVVPCSCIEWYINTCTNAMHAYEFYMCMLCWKTDPQPARLLNARVILCTLRMRFICSGCCCWDTNVNHMLCCCFMCSRRSERRAESADCATENKCGNKEHGRGRMNTPHDVVVDVYAQNHTHLCWLSLSPVSVL